MEQIARELGQNRSTRVRRHSALSGLVTFLLAEPLEITSVVCVTLRPTSKKFVAGAHRIAGCGARARPR